MIKLRLPLKDIFVTQFFGQNFVDFYQKMGLTGHPGVDFRTRHRCPLYAASGGIVTRAGKWSDGGIGIEITHAQGWSTFYYHLDESLAKVGDKIIAGDLIGYCDNTGRYTTGDHLHFELRLADGSKVNPAPYFFYTYNGIEIKNKDWDKSRSYHRYYRVANRSLANEMKTALYMARRLKRLPNNEEINMAIWGGWDIESIMNPSMWDITSQITKDEFVNQGLKPYN